MELPLRGILFLKTNCTESKLKKGWPLYLFNFATRTISRKVHRACCFWGWRELMICIRQCQDILRLFLRKIPQNFEVFFATDFSLQTNSYHSLQGWASELLKRWFGFIKLVYRYLLVQLRVYATHGAFSVFDETACKKSAASTPNASWNDSVAISVRRRLWKLGKEGSQSKNRHATLTTISMFFAEENQRSSSSGEFDGTVFVMLIWLLSPKISRFLLKMTHQKLNEKAELIVSVVTCEALPRPK